MVDDGREDTPKTADEPSVTDFVDRTPGQGDASAPATGEDRVAHYRLIKELGRGGQAVVWLAEDTNLRRRVALKLVQGLGPDTPQTYQRFRREVEITSKLDQPGICPVYEVGFEPVPWIAMRLVQGETLAARIADARAARDEDQPSSHFVSLGSDVTTDDGEERSATRKSTSSRTTPRELMVTVRLIEKTARALHAAHEAGVIHRDVKPGNIMVDEGGDPVLLDFGLARDDEADTPTLTATGDLMGTPAYMSPEQLTRQATRLDRRTDVYSLGVTLFECLTTRRPFEGPTRMALYDAILTEPTPDPRRLNPAISRDLRVVVETAMAKNRDDRYQTALELAEDLRRVREIEPITARPAGPVKRLTRWAQRSPAVAAMTTALFLTLVAGLVWREAKNREISEESEQKDAAITAKDTALEKERDALAERIRMSDVKRLANARAEAETLWPVHPDLVPRIEAWLETYRPLFARLPEHRVALERIRAKAGPYTEADRRRDHGDAIDELAVIEKQTSEVEDAMEEGDDGTLAERLADLDDRADELRASLSERSWDFGDDVDAQFMHETYHQIVRDLAAFVDPVSGVVPNVEQRLALSKTIEARTVDAHADAWRDTLQAIKESPLYGGLDLEPQIGFIPLGPDPDTGYFEFLSWLSHTGGTPLPVRNDDGRFEPKPEDGFIFVLLPGGSSLMGAQRTDPGAPNHDPEAAGIDGPVHEVVLAPFFMGKYEVTQEQWRRMNGQGKGYYGAGTKTGDGLVVTPVHPVEMISWNDSTFATFRVGLALPTEAQWEYAARGGTSTVWSCGNDRTDLDEFANLADSHCQRNGGSRRWTYETDLDDGRVIHAPIGTYAPNPFGLFDVHGNVNEWCRDGHGAYATTTVEAGEGLRRVPAPRSHIFRGGSFREPARSARAAFRGAYAPEARDFNLGLRVSARVQN